MGENSFAFGHNDGEEKHRYAKGWRKRMEKRMREERRKTKERREKKVKNKVRITPEGGKKQIQKRR